MNPRACSRLVALAFLSALGLPSARAWDYEGHRIINQLALASLPSDFPAFVHESTAADRIAFLAGEPDRWRNVSDLPLRNENNPDHYLDLEQLGCAGLDPASVSPLRYEFAVQFAAGRAAHLDKFPPIDPAKNADHTREWPGFLPWTIAEYFGRLKSAFSYLKAFETGGGTATEIANAQYNIVYQMGVMGHFVGDGSQPLHVTVYHHGWEGDNPHGYTTDPKFHAWIDGGVFANNPSLCAFAEAKKVFPEAQDYLVVSLGTGELTRLISYDDAKNWGVAGWALPILSVVFHGVSVTVDYQMKQILPPDGSVPRYYRFEVRLDKGNDDMDDASNTNLHALVSLAEELIASQQQDLDSLCHQLVI
ncbi:MAG: hypothetical protein ABSA97_15735 [Verrucomicrobiia bacterium]